MRTAYQHFCRVVDDAAQLVATRDPAVVERVKVPERVHVVSVPLTRDDGSQELLKGYRVQHSSARGPYKGGIRFHPQVTLDEVMALAGWMSIKNAVVDIPLGGGKGGVVVDAHALSVRELESLTRSYTERIWRDIGPDVDVPAPDVNTTPQVMDWLADEYARLTGVPSPAVVTGKSMSAGGSQGRDTATAQGGFEVLKEALATAGEGLAGRTAAIQGFGNAGSNAALLLKRAGVRVVAASDSTAAVYSEEGLPVNQLARFKKEAGFFSDLTRIEKRHRDSVLFEDVDILVPAALEGQITAENAGQIRARYVLELANGPTTPAADRILNRRGTVVLPDVLANAGGVVVSYFEWEQNVQGERWSRDEVAARLAAVMKRAYAAVVDLAEARRTSLRLAAYGIAIDRIAAALETREHVGPTKAAASPWGD